MGAIRDKLQGTNKKLKIAVVELTPELAELVDHEPIYVRTMTAGESGLYEASQCSTGKSADGEPEAKVDLSQDRQQLLVRTICDMGGNREYADDDIPAISLLDRRIADAIYDKASEINGLGKTGKAARDALKKSSTTPAALSPAGSA